MLGGFDGWVASSIGGIDSFVNGSSGGWRHIAARVSPAAVAIIKTATYSKLTRFGETTFNWKWDGTKLVTEISVPIGSDLTLETPMALQLRSGAVVHLSTLGEGEWSLWADSAAQQVMPTGVLSVAGSSPTAAVTTTIGSGQYVFEAVYA
jgi:hypothetical protein